MKAVILNYILLLILGCTQKKVQDATQSSLEGDRQNVLSQTKNDSLATEMSSYDETLLDSYRYEIIRDIINERKSTEWGKLDSIFEEGSQGRMFLSKNLYYSRDSTVKIFTYGFESCGAYCGSIEWTSWLHFKTKTNEKIIKTSIAEVEQIHKLSENEYLIIDRSWSRPFSVLTYQILSAKQVFLKDGKITFRRLNKWKSLSNELLEFSHPSIIENDTLPFPFIKFDTISKILSFGYGSNDRYPEPYKNDTFYFGTLKYKKGTFHFIKIDTICSKRNDVE